MWIVQKRCKNVVKNLCIFWHIPLTYVLRCNTFGQKTACGMGEICVTKLSMKPVLSGVCTLVVDRTKRACFVHWSRGVQKQVRRVDKRIRKCLDFSQRIDFREARVSCFCPVLQFWKACFAVKNGFNPNRSLERRTQRC